ncbi:F0F1 ATP synthase subunit delta [Streptococcus pacificus]|uniref:ATP synthase subunit delta n=1 Tax=Streptococcus pacificus TaxID=2740577 RepID=A0ABS0ZK47_9STRE|nr:F0F1 ATP synthase subunit delta [Streptococcus pacificus]MBJ8325906.1 F0F1 ATP synthase subunit delta [Streptococcus pacificus]
MDKRTYRLIEQYAKSLVEVAIEKNSIAVIEEDISDILSICRDNHLDQYFADLSIDVSNKVKLVRLFQNSQSEYLNNFLEVIIQNERMALLVPIFETVLDRLSHETNTFDIKVTSAVSLTETQKERLLAIVAQKFDLTPRRLIEEIDEELIGGFIISANNKVIDTSIRHQLQTLKMKLK